MLLFQFGINIQRSEINTKTFSIKDTEEQNEETSKEILSFQISSSPTNFIFANIWLKTNGFV